MPVSDNSVAENRKPLPPLILGVKRGLWRMHDPFAEEADADFAGVRQRVAKHYKHTCVYCDMKTLPQESERSPTKTSPGYFEVHHLDDNHQNNALDNLVMVCPFCHNVFHCGNAGKRDAGKIIWAPWIRQEDLNLLCHVLFIMMTFGQNDPETVKNGAAFTKAAERISNDARSRYQQLSSLGDDLENQLGRGLSNASVMGEALMILGSESAEAYKNRGRFLSGARFLPDYSYYMKQVMYWRRANNADIKGSGGSHVLYPDMLERYWEQWQKTFLAG